MGHLKRILKLEKELTMMFDSDVRVGLALLEEIRKLKNMNEKLYRRNGYVGGVCQGLGEWSGIPSILWRVGFLFFIPAAFWVYVVLWMILKKNY